MAHTRSFLLTNLLPGIKPHSEAVISIDDLPDLQSLKVPRHHEESYLVLYFVSITPPPMDFAPPVATGQFQLTKPQSLPSIRTLQPASSAPYIKSTPSTLEIRSSSGFTSWTFSTALGLLTSWRHNDGPNFLTESPSLGFYRALTDNDRGGHGREWHDRRLHQASNHNRGTTWKETETGAVVTVTGRFAPPVLAWGVDTTIIYTFSGDQLHIRVKASPDPKSIRLPGTFARIGLTLGLKDVGDVSWWGRGPGESYRDSKHAQLFGLYTKNVDELWTDYEFPQDGGNRTDVRTVVFKNSVGKALLRARFGDLEGASFSASRYSTKDIDEATHPYELRKKRREDTVVRLDWAHHGLGTGSCGPWTRWEYQLRSSQHFDYEVLLDPAIHW